MKNLKPRSQARGFTLIEVVGVLTVLAVLAAIVGENVLQRLRRAARQAEEQSVAAVADGLRRNILRTKSILAVTNMAGALAIELGEPPERVLQTIQGEPRWFWIDPTYEVGTNSTQRLPYAQRQQAAFGLTTCVC